MAWPARWMRLAPIGEEAGRRAIYAALAGMQTETAPPILAWVQGDVRHDFALIVPKRFAPGRSCRWTSWALSPAIATCRQFGLPVYLDKAGLWLHGRPYAGGSIEQVGECVVAASHLAIPFPIERHIEDQFRLRIEAQYDWGFETSWPNPAEADALAEARSEFAW